jgi:uncharacterized protein (TIGR04222 family)
VNVMASSNLTWGISGPEFLAGYGLLALVSLVGVVIVRWWLAAGSAGASAVQPAKQPRDIAYLNGGPQLAVLSALSSMRVAGTILLEGSGRVHAGQAPGEGADELERAIHLTAIEPIAWQQLITHRIVRTALESVRQRLEGAGLLLSAQRRRRIKLVGLWMVAVAALGLVRVLAGAANSAPVGYLILDELLAVGIVSVLLLRRAPTHSRRGTARLKNLRATHTELAPEMCPDWTAYGPALAGLGVGIFGASALWASDPDLAAGVGVRRYSAASRYSGAGCGDAGYYGGGGGGGGCSSAGHSSHSGGFFGGHSGCGGGHGGGGCGGGHGGGGCGGGGGHG